MTARSGPPKTFFARSPVHGAVGFDSQDRFLCPLSWLAPPGLEEERMDDEGVR